MGKRRGAVEFVTKSQIRKKLCDPSGISDEFWMLITTDGKHFQIFEYADV